MTVPSAAAEAYCPTCNRSYPEGTATCPADGDRLIRFRAEEDPLIGRVLDDRFEIRRRLGRGGMGTVYVAWQRSVEREVAIKLIDPRLAHDRTVAKRFLREARLASRLQHHGIVHVLDSGQTDDDLLYIAMELLRGPPLAELLPLPLSRALPIAARICEALEAAHAIDIVHRDLKPQNVVVLDGDLVKVLDFGLAKSLVGDGTTITRDDALMGTPLYMAPEVIDGQAAGPASDLYSLGCILHELVMGTPPFVAGNPNAVLARHLSETPPPAAAAPGPVRILIARLLDKDPTKRPSAAETRTMLLRTDAGAIADTIEATRPPRRRRGWIVAAIVLPVAVIALALTRHEDAAPAVVPMAAPDAARAPDAAHAPDAAPALDAAPPPDAARKKPPSGIKKKPPPPDAGPAKPPPPRAPVDADINFLPVN